jgi:hypothetical protein
MLKKEYEDDKMKATVVTGSGSPEVPRPGEVERSTPRDNGMPTPVHASTTNISFGGGGESPLVRRYGTQGRECGYNRGW